MKIVLFPGVGFQKDKHPYNKFLTTIQEGLNCEGEVFYWKHDWPLPDIELPYNDVRKWVFEVILDFQQVIRHAKTMKVPEADYYLGHSAGSIIALVQKKPCIIFGSPAALVECIHDMDVNAGFINLSGIRYDNNHSKVFNIINEYDQLAYYLDEFHVENYVYKNGWWNPSTYNAISCHSDYWGNKKVMNKIVEVIKTWEKNKE